MPGMRQQPHGVAAHAFTEARSSLSFVSAVSLLEAYGEHGESAFQLKSRESSERSRRNDNQMRRTSAQDAIGARFTRSVPVE